jgi:hypothetical protein
MTNLQYQFAQRAHVLSMLEPLENGAMSMGKDTAGRIRDLRQSVADYDANIADIVAGRL